MRVITGIAKGHRLKAPAGLATRPMLDRVKESLFSILEGYSAIYGRILDLYAGSGSLGIECLSRGAEKVDFVEQSGSVCRVIRQNLHHTGFDAQGHIYCMPVGRYIRREVAPYDMIIMDPPYADPAIQQTIADIAALRVGAETSVLVVGHSPRVELADAYGPYACLKFRRLGDSCFSVYDRG